MNIYPVRPANPESLEVLRVIGLNFRILKHMRATKSKQAFDAIGQGLFAEVGGAHILEMGIAKGTGHQVEKGLIHPA